MAAAVVDVDINEGDTFVMVLDLWENQDKTIPIDITPDTFTGSMKFGTKVIPLIIEKSILVVNSITATTDFNLMRDLGLHGSYEIDQKLPSGESYRLIQGRVLVNQEVNI